jgi:hypothetical protein
VGIGYRGAKPVSERYLQGRPAILGTWLMAFQTSEAIVNFPQISILAIAGKMKNEGAVKVRAIKREAQSFNLFFLNKALLHFPDTIGCGMGANHYCTLGGNLDVFDLKAIMLSPLDLDH